MNRIKKNVSLQDDVVVNTKQCGQEGVVNISRLEPVSTGNAVLRACATPAEVPVRAEDISGPEMVILAQLTYFALSILDFDHKRSENLSPIPVDGGVLVIKQVEGIARALYPFAGDDNNNTLSINHPGEEFTVVEVSPDGWVLVINSDGARGFVPQSYIQLLPT